MKSIPSSIISMSILTIEYYKKNRMALLIAVFCQIFCFPLGSFAEDAAGKNVVHWGIRHFPPLYILDGDQKGQGMADQMLDLLIKNLPDYQHEKIVANNKRVEAQIQKGEKFARLTMIKTPDREQYMHYSVAHYVSPSHRLIVRREILPKIQSIISDSNEISLENLLNVQDIRIGVELGRSIGKGLDVILKKYEGQKNISVIPSPDTVKTVQMLLLGHLDCIIEYPTVITFTLKRQPDKLKQITSITIKEADPYIVAYAVAPKNEWGHTLIQKVNEIFKREIPTENYRMFIEKWLDESSVAPFRSEYQRLLVDTLR